MGSGLAELTTEVRWSSPASRMGGRSPQAELRPLAAFAESRSLRV